MRNEQRGGVMLVVMVGLTGVLAAGLMSVHVVGSNARGGGTERFRLMALYAAESGVQSAMMHLRGNFDPTTYWSGFVETNNTNVTVNTAIPGSGVRPADTGHKPFSTGVNAWYEVRIFNNPDDPGLSSNVIDDTDAVVIIQSIGHGPNNALAVLTMGLTPGTGGGGGGPGTLGCGAYVQGNQNELGAGFNPCLQNVDSTEFTTYTAGGGP